jgi:hypothetical protein
LLLLKWHWDSYYGSCWRFNSDADKFSTKDGKINGLNLNLYIASVDDFYSFKSTRGAHIYIHNKSSNPLFFEGFDVGVNIESNIIVSREFSSSLSSPYSSCVQDITYFGSVFTEMFVKNNKEYTQQSCFE